MDYVTEYIEILRACGCLVKEPLSVTEPDGSSLFLRMFVAKALDTVVLSCLPTLYPQMEMDCLVSSLKEQSP